MGDAASDIADLVFVAVTIIVIAGIVLYFHKKGNESYRRTERLIAQRGYALTHARERHRGPVTWIWGRFEAPQPFYLHISNRDPLASIAGKFGITDITVGDERFDEDFTVRSNQPEWARELLTPARCQRLLRFNSLQFLATSIDSLLTPDYYPDEKERDLRVLWMLRVDGHLDDTEAAPYLTIARELKEAVRQFGQRQPHTIEDCRSTMFEGR